MLRFAEERDVPTILEVLESFHNETPYGDIPLNVDSLRNLVSGLIKSDRNQSIILVDEEQDFRGFIAATKTPFLVTGAMVANEMFWYVKPEYRGTRVGLTLMDAFEFWAKRVGCTHCQLTTSQTEYADKLNKLYQRRGYHIAEHVYLKEI